MDDYAGRVLADRYRLPLPPSDEFELAETRAFDTYSGHEVLVRQVPLPEIVEAEVLDADDLVGAAVPHRAQGRRGGTTRRPTDPAVRRAVEAAQAAAQIPDHPRLDQVFDVFAEDGSLWIVSERVAARPLAALLAEKPLSPYRAAEIASDVLTALRVLHAHGWTHRNITVRTVLVCEDGRVVLTGLASGAAEEALCGYAPVPEPDPETEPGAEAEPFHPDRGPAEGPPHVDDQPSRPELPRQAGGAPDVRAARAGAIAAYRAGARAGARVNEDRSHDDGTEHDDRPVQSGLDPDWWAHRPEERRGGLLGLGEGREEDGDADFGALGFDGLADDTEDFGRGGRGGGDAYAGGRDGDAGFGGDAYADDRDGGSGFGGDAYAGGRYVDDRDGEGYGVRRYGESPVEDDEYDDHTDREGPQGGHGRARLAGTWHDAPFAGREGPGSLPVGGGGGAGPRGIVARPPLPGARSHDPYRDDPYGVRRAETGRGRAAPSALPVARADSGPGGTGSGPSGGRRPALPPARTGGTAGSSWDRGGDALRADAQRRPVEAAGNAATGRWEEVVADGRAPAYRGPATPLAAERARQARITVVGAVTERWAPEQAGPVHENWQLAAPVGPATDLWALGALLYRAVQGHAPYPEESAAELVQLVCAEPPAFAEECGPLRPVVESLLRQDPTERPDFEELRGWLRSLVRSAPEPEAGMDVVPLPAGVVDGSRLPIVRRRGELVRRRRGGVSDAAHGRHRHKKAKGRERDRAVVAPPREADRRTARQAPRQSFEHSYEESYETSYRPQRSYGDERRKPRSLGRTLLVLILLALVAAIAYAVLFMPKADDQQGAREGGNAGAQHTESGPSPGRTGGGQAPDPAPSGTPGSQQPQTSAPAGDLPEGYALRKDPEGFQVVVDKAWQRRPINDAGQVRYTGDDFTLIIVPGRDTVQANGDDPLAYQRDKEPELQPFRDSSWATASGLRRIDVGRQSMAEGQFTWQDSNGRDVYVRNLALAVDGAYHVVQVIGPEAQRDKVTEVFEQATASYRATR
ncbi:protein kinase [Streptomyces sp. NPDC096176]|uniref:protein kinase n=1 Tax=Streptomyces sp. NPDC096176 TaxID=3366079 RepID=UPI00381FE293